MTDIGFSIAIPNGTQAAASFLGWGDQLNASMIGTMSIIVDRLQSDAVDNMQWMNPTGALSQSGYTVATVWQGIVGYTVPYARRREYGFSGMTDSLGRFYPDDPGKFYLTRALDSNMAFIASSIAATVAGVMRSPGTP
jgi:hypothetical protein